MDGWQGALNQRLTVDEDDDDGIPSDESYDRCLSAGILSRIHHLMYVGGGK